MASSFRRKQLRPLHALATLIHFQPRRWEGSDVRSRRRLQRRNLLQQLVEDQNEFNWIFKPKSAPIFWRSLRWGGIGILIGCVLAKLST
jgi:hypothetical protein